MAVFATTLVSIPWNTANGEESQCGEMIGKRFWMTLVKHWPHLCRHNPGFISYVSQ